MIKNSIISLQTIQKNTEKKNRKNFLVMESNSTEFLQDRA